MKVKDCMCNEVEYATPSSTVHDCVTMMYNKHIGCVPVCNKSQNVVGLVTDRDIILRCIACNKDPNTTPVSEIMTCEVCCCDANADVKEAENLMSKNQVKRIPIIEDNKLIGMLTLGDLAANNNIDDTRVGDTLNNICSCNKKNAQ